MLNNIINEWAGNLRRNLWDIASPLCWLAGHFSSSHIQRLSKSCRWRSWWSWRDFQWWCPPKSLPKRSHDDGDDITIQRNSYGLYRDLIIDIGQGLGERRNPIMLWYHSPCTRQMLTIKPIRPSIFWTFSDSSFFLFSWTHGGSDNFTTLECLGYVRMVIYGCMYMVKHGYVYIWLCYSPPTKKIVGKKWTISMKNPKTDVRLNDYFMAVNIQLREY